VYVRSYPSKAGRLQISVAGGEWPIWSHDGTRLYFSQGRRLMAVAFSGGGPESAADRPEAVLEGFDFGRGAVDVLPDGDSFVLVQPATRGLVEVRVVDGRVPGPTTLTILILALGSGVEHGPATLPPRRRRLAGPPVRYRRRVARRFTMLPCVVCRRRADVGSCQARSGDR
jgi:hypothetical protein